MVPPSSHKVSRAPWYSGTPPAQILFVYATLMLFGQPSQIVRLRIFRFMRLLTPKVRRLSVWALPRSLAATWGISFDFFSSGYLDVSVHRVVSPKSDGISSAGLPHSGIRESKPACGSSRLFAAFRALLRPNTPGHPPCALGSFTFTPLKILMCSCFFLCNFQGTGGSGKT